MAFEEVVFLGEGGWEVRGDGEGFVDGGVPLEEFSRGEGVVGEEEVVDGVDFVAGAAVAEFFDDGKKGLVVVRGPGAPFAFGDEREGVGGHTGRIVGGVEKAMLGLVGEDGGEDSDGVDGPDGGAGPVEVNEAANLLGFRMAAEAVVEGDEDGSGEGPGESGAGEEDEVGGGAGFDDELDGGEEFDEHEGEDDEGDVAGVLLVEVVPMGGFDEGEGRVVDELDGPDESE